MVGGKAEDIIFTSGGTEVTAFIPLLCCAQKVLIFEKSNSLTAAPVFHSRLTFFQANNLVLHTAVEHFRRNCRAVEHDDGHQNGSNGLPHIITSNVEHDSIKLVAEHLKKEGKAGRRKSWSTLFRLIH